PVRALVAVEGVERRERLLAALAPRRPEVDDRDLDGGAVPDADLGRGGGELLEGRGLRTGEGVLQRRRHGPRPAGAQRRRAPEDEREEEGPATHCAQHIAGQARAPKIAVPTRTMVAPSAIATGKSCVIPIESSGSAPAPPCSSRSRRSASKKGRAPSGSGVSGGIVMRPE